MNSVNRNDESSWFSLRAFVGLVRHKRGCGDVKRDVTLICNDFCYDVQDLDGLYLVIWIRMHLYGIRLIEPCYMDLYGPGPGPIGLVYGKTLSEWEGVIRTGYWDIWAVCMLACWWLWGVAVAGSSSSLSASFRKHPNFLNRPWNIIDVVFVHTGVHPKTPYRPQKHTY